MKKFLTVILVVATVLSLAVPAFADMDAPAFAEFNAYVTNVDGAEVYESDYIEYEDSFGGYSFMKKTGKVLPEGSEIRVTGEYEVEGVLYLYCKFDDDYGYVKNTDVATEKAEIPYTQGEKLSKPRKMIVFGDGFYLRKGPSNAYDTIGPEIKKGTVITVEYSLPGGDYAPWAYIIHNGIGGWGEIFQYGGAFFCADLVDENSPYTGSLYVFSDDVRLIDKPVYPYEGNSAKSKFITDPVPAGTKLTFDYYYHDAKSVYVYTEYNGVKGWVETDESFNGPSLNRTAIGIYNIQYVWQDEGLPVYSKLGDTSSEILTTFEKGSLVKCVYKCVNDEDDKSKPMNEYGEYPWIEKAWYGVEVDGKLGWMHAVTKSEENGEKMYFWEVNHYMTDGTTVNVYENHDVNSELVATIPENTDFVILGFGNDQWCFVDYNGKTGWAEYDENSFIHIKENEDYYRSYTIREYWDGKLTTEYLKAIRTGTYVEPTTAEPTMTATEAKTTAVQSEKQQPNMSASQIAVFCVAGALVIAATAAVIIILINKKKKENA